MAQSAAMRPYGFSQPSYVTAKAKRRLDPSASDYDRTPCPSDNESKYAATKGHGRRASDSHGPYWTTSASQPRSAVAKAGLKLQISHKQARTLPDEDEDDAYPSRRSYAHEKRRPDRLQPSRHAQRPSLVSPITPTTIKKLGEMQVRTPSSERVPLHGTKEEQIAQVSAALRRVEADRKRLQDQIEAEVADRYKIQREVEAVRKENRRLMARLEELMRSPLSARSDDAWGCSMYDHEVDGQY